MKMFDIQGLFSIIKPERLIIFPGVRTYQNKTRFGQISNVGWRAANISNKPHYSVLIVLNLQPLLIKAEFLW